MGNKTMKKILSFFLILFLVCSCTRSVDTISILEDAGYTNIEITGWRPFKCSWEDTFATGFTANSLTGTQISGTVCASLFSKGSTIRFD